MGRNSLLLTFYIVAIATAQTDTSVRFRRSESCRGFPRHRRKPWSLRARDGAALSLSRHCETAKRPLQCCGAWEKLRGGSSYYNDPPGSSNYYDSPRRRAPPPDGSDNYDRYGRASSDATTPPSQGYPDEAWSAADDRDGYYAYDYEDEYERKRLSSRGQPRDSSSSSMFASLVPSVLKTGDRRVGLLLLGAGTVVTMLGMSLFFNKTLMRLGNLLFIAGVPVTLGPSRVAGYFIQPQKARATACLGLGIFLVLVGWPVFGIALEVFGLLNLFGNLFPVVLAVAKQMPIVGTILNSGGGGRPRSNNNYKSNQRGRDRYYEDEEDYYFEGSEGQQQDARRRDDDGYY